MFGIDLFDASMLPALSIAMLAGVLSFLSPCVLPIVPPYLAYMAGTTLQPAGPGAEVARGPDWRVVNASIFFILGLSTVFMVLGFTASLIGQMFLRYQNYLAIGSGLVIILFGLHFLHVIRIPILDQDRRFDAGGDRGGTAFGAYVMGLAFAFGWTPCIGPILGMIISMAAQEDTVSRGLVLMLGYVTGLGLPFLIVALSFRRALGTMARIKRHMGTIEKVTGGLLVVVGVMLSLGIFTKLSLWLVERFPALGLIG
jgi:cytochrome c-type biogenesis protein